MYEYTAAAEEAVVNQAIAQYELLTCLRFTYVADTASLSVIYLLFTADTTG